MSDDSSSFDRCWRAVSEFRTRFAATLNKVESAAGQHLDVQCVACDEESSFSAAFDPPNFRITVCGRETEDGHATLLKHELVHVHDMVLLRLDSNDDDALACMEVRAYRWAQCEHEWWQKACTRERTLNSVGMHVPDAARAKELVERNWKRCYEEAPNLLD